MTAPNRLEHLQKLVQADLSVSEVVTHLPANLTNTTKMLPDRHPAALAISEDEGDSGGVPIDSVQSEGVLIDLPEDQGKLTTNLPVRPAPIAPQNVERRFVVIEGAASSYNPGSERQTTTSAPVSHNSLPSTDLQRGDLTSPRHHFTPIIALSKYPYRFCDKQHSQDIASAFFDQGKFWLREWDL